MPKKIIIGLLCLMMGCSGMNVAMGEPGAAASATKAAAEKTKVCFNCEGTGLAKCAVATCKDGKMDCPGPCMKLSKGVWRHMKVEGHPDTDLWQQFPRKGGSTGWNQHHVGEVIQMQNGEPVNIGACKVCGGTTKVQCTTCKGSGKAACNICDGKKMVPESWSSFDNPKMKNRPNLIHMKDGKTIVGKIVMSGGAKTRIKTEQGDVEVPAEDVVSEEKQQGK
ncbi:MAG: hypothetical protein JWQ71_1514 [Pedosphaera sp.]|nr:hypothetical protein [Pedosphaera sp.]